MLTKNDKQYTKKLYWHDAYLFAHEATVIDAGKSDEKGFWVKVNETIFHPQGGGQPSDEGAINGIKVKKLEEERIDTANLDYDLGIITHYLEDDPDVVVGDMVKLEIDGDKRLHHSALHTSGHILAGVMRKEHDYKKQVGANHFPKQSKVEFQKDGSSISESVLDQQVRAIIKEGLPVTEEFQETPEIYRHPDRSSSARCVTIFGLWTEPCSGTHLKSTNEIQNFRIRNKKIERNKVSIGYDAGYGFFSGEEIETPVATETPKSVALKAGNANNSPVKTFTLDNDTTVAFFLSKGEIRASVTNSAAKETKYAPKNIHINLADSPEETIQLQRRSLSWRLNALERLEELSLAFNGEIVITKLTDWSFDESIQNRPTLSLGQ